jgi:hypothetical protein
MSDQTGRLSDQTGKKRGRPMHDIISDIIDWEFDAAIASALGFLR